MSNGDLKSKIIKKIKDNTNVNSKTLKAIEEIHDDHWELKKAITGFNPFNLVKWTKALSNLFYIGLLVAIIFGIVYGIGYYKGIKNQPIRIDGDAGEERVIEVINGGGLRHTIEIKDGGKVYFDGELQKIKSLSKGKPYGFRLQPGIGFVDFKPSGFLNIAYLKKINIDVFGNTSLVGGGASYQIYLQKPFTINNTYLGLGLGYDIKENDKKYILYIKVNF